MKYGTVIFNLRSSTRRTLLSRRPIRVITALITRGKEGAEYYGHLICRQATLENAAVVQKSRAVRESVRRKALRFSKRETFRIGDTAPTLYLQCIEVGHPGYACQEGDANQLAGNVPVQIVSLCNIRSLTKKGEHVHVFAIRGQVFFKI